MIYAPIARSIMGPLVVGGIIGGKLMCDAAKDLYDKWYSKEPSRTSPDKGEPNSSHVLPNKKGPGKFRERFFGPDGKPIKDIDYDNHPGVKNPHVHDWINGVRQKPRNPNPGEVE